MPRRRLPDGARVRVQQRHLLHREPGMVADVFGTAIESTSLGVFTVEGEDEFKIGRNTHSVLVLHHPAAPDTVFYAIPANLTEVEPGAGTSEGTDVVFRPGEMDCEEDVCEEGGAADEEELEKMTIDAVGGEGLAATPVDSPVAAEQTAAAAAAAAAATKTKEGAPSIWGAWDAGVAVDIEQSSGVPAYRFHSPQLLGNIVQIFDIFELMLPPLDGIVEASNKHNPELRLTLEELRRWIGLIMVAADFPGLRTEDLWSRASDQHPLRPLPSVGDVMSRQRFRALCGGIMLPGEVPEGDDDAAEANTLAVRQLVKLFNDHMESVYNPSSLCAIDESMVAYQRRSIPHYKFISRKPHPAGTEYFDIADSVGVVFRMRLAEKASAAARRQAGELTPTGDVMLFLCETICSTARIVVVDSYFAVLPAIAKLSASGVYMFAVCKKKGKNWPRYYRGEEVVQQLSDKPKGTVVARVGELKGRPLLQLGIKYRRFDFLAVSSYGSAVPKGEELDIEGADDHVHFSIPHLAPLADYYSVRGKVDDSNHLRQGCAVALEAAWPSRRWTMRQLLFVVALVAANSLAYFKHLLGTPAGNRFGVAKGEYTAARWQREVSYALLGYRSRLVDNAPASAPPAAAAKRRSAMRSASRPKHFQQHLPPGKGRLNPKTKKRVEVKTEYAQMACQALWPEKCKHRTRVHCACDESLYLCESCFAVHVQQVYSAATAKEH